jgi:hypothetical protein
MGFVYLTERHKTPIVSPYQNLVTIHNLLDLRTPISLNAEQD